MREREGMALGLAYLFGAGALLVVITVILPHGHGENVPALLGIAGAAVAVVTFIALEGRRLPPAAFAVILVFGSVLVGGLTWWGGDAARVYPLFYLWVAIYGFYFFGARLGLGVTLFSAATYVLVLVVRDVTPVPWVDGFMVVGTAVVAGTFIGRLVQQARRRTRDLDAAAHLASAMSTGAEMDRVPEAICRAALEACEADAAVLFEGEERRAAVGSADAVERLVAAGELGAARTGAASVGRAHRAITGRVPVLAVPVLREGAAVGAIAVGWDRPARLLPESAESAAALFAGVAAATFEREERLSGERERRALEINDSVLQGLVVAKYALAAGRTDEVERAVDETLTRARDLMNRQLSEVPGTGAGVRPGDLRRERPGLDR